MYPSAALHTQTWLWNWCQGEYDVGNIQGWRMHQGVDHGYHNLPRQAVSIKGVYLGQSGLTLYVNPVYATLTLSRLQHRLSPSGHGQCAHQYTAIATWESVTLPPFWCLAPGICKNYGNIIDTQPVPDFIILDTLKSNMYWQNCTPPFSVYL